MYADIIILQQIASHVPRVAGEEEEKGGVVNESVSLEKLVSITSALASQIASVNTSLERSVA